MPNSDLTLIVIGGVVLWFLLDEIGSLGSGLNDTLGSDLNNLLPSGTNTPATIDSSDWDIFSQMYAQ